MTKPAAWLEQIADPDPGRIRRRIAPSLQLGDVGFSQGVQRQAPLVAQLEDRESGEGLAHRGDAKQAVGVDRAPRVDVQHARGPDMDQTAAAHDRPRHPRHMLLLLEVPKMAVDRWDNLFDRRRRDGRRRGWRLSLGKARNAEHQGEKQPLFPGHDVPSRAICIGDRR